MCARFWSFRCQQQSIVFILASYIVVALVLAKLRVSMEGVCIYICIYLYTHTFFFLKSGAGFLAICCILELKYPIYMPTWLLALASPGFTWLLAFGFWLLAVGFARLLVFVGFWFLSSGG